MPLTDTQKEQAQQILLEELEKRRAAQPLLLIDSILDGTIKAKARMAVLMRRNEIQATHDAADARIAASKAAMMALIGELNTVAVEINGA